MNLAVVNEAVTEMNGVEHQFTEEEKNFVPGRIEWWCRLGGITIYSAYSRLSLRSRTL